MKPHSDEQIEVFCAYIIRKGKKIYPPKGKKCWHFTISKKTT